MCLSGGGRGERGPSWATDGSTTNGVRGLQAKMVRHARSRATQHCKCRRE